MAEIPSMGPRDIARRYRSTWPGTSFLADLDPTALHDFLGRGELTRFRKDQDLIVEGERATDTFLLLEAVVKVTARLDSGGKALLAIRVGGDIVGEITAMDGGPRTATVSACGHQPTLAVRLGLSDLRDLLDRHPRAALSLASAISRKLRAESRRHVDMIGCTAEVAMARVVLELAEDYGRATGRGTTLVGVSLTQAELGTLIGVKETRAHRALRHLREKGLITLNGRSILVPRMADLRLAARAM